jgi:DNA-binding MarR family transcriptional regulator
MGILLPYSNLVLSLYTKKDCRLLKLRAILGFTLLLSVEKSTSTRLIQPLVEQGLVIKEASPTDNRAVILKLTDKGVEMHKAIWSCLDDFLSRVSEEIPAEIRAEVFKHVLLFNKAIRNVFDTTRCC